MATFALVPLSFATFLIVYLVISFMPWTGNLFAWFPNAVYLLWFLAPAAVFYLGGLAIWWPCVRWTPGRRLRVIGASVLLLVLTAAPFLMGVWGATWWLEADYLGIFLSVVVSLCGGAAALIYIAKVCYDPPNSRGGRAPCPACGYDLRGQRECRCPECGGEFTLGDLLETLDPMHPRA